MEPFNQEDRPPDAEENPGRRYRQRLGGLARPRAHPTYIQDHPAWRITQGAVFQIHSHKARITRALDPQQLPCGRSRDRVLAEAETKTFADAGNLLTMSVSAGLSKDSGSLQLIHTIQRTTQQQFTNGLHIRAGSRSVPTRCRSPISSRMINCKLEKRLSTKWYPQPPL